MLTQWLRSHPEVAWEDVVSALERMGNNHVARCIQERHCGGEIREAGLKKHHLLHFCHNTNL